MKVIMFDMDGVLVNFVEGFNNRVKQLYPQSLMEIKKEKEWDFSLDKILLDEVWDNIYEDPTFWYNLKPNIEYATLREINFLQKNNLIYFVTNRKGINKKEQTIAWLEKYNIMEPMVIFTKYKGETAKVIGADFSIDDKPENAWCVSWMSPLTESYLLKTPYYTKCDFGSHKVKEVDKVSKFISCIKEII